MIKQVKLEDRWGEDKTLKPVTILKKARANLWLLFSNRQKRHDKVKK